jgi:hypothetical protein
LILSQKRQQALAVHIGEVASNEGDDKQIRSKKGDRGRIVAFRNT